MTANDIKAKLKSTSWIKSFTGHLFPFIWKMKTPPSFKTFEEVTIRIPTRKKTKFGKPKPQRRRFDVIAFVKPFYKAFGSEIFTIGIEIKVSKSDLIGDSKMKDYLGYTDYFFLVVPSKLLDAAKEVIKGESKIGLIEAETLKCLLLPVGQKVGYKKNSEVFRELLLKELT